MQTTHLPNVARSCRRAAAWLAGLLICAATAHAAEPPLKACADPDNLPFSSASGAPSGFYVELADRLASALGRATEPVWHLTYFGKRAVRSTLLARECDLFIGLPADSGFMAQQVSMSKPFAVFRYALVLPRSSAVQSLADLRGRRVAVQLSSPPQSLLVAVEDIQTVTVLSPEEGMRALADGRADAAYLWGPSVGYLNKTLYASRYRVLPTEGQAMAWPIAIGFRLADTALRERVQQELDRLGPWLAELEAKYGFPSGAPLRFASANRVPSEWIRTVAANAADAPASAATGKAASGNEAAITHGRQLFNTNCAHCHGPNAASPDPKIDLRKLAKRYGDDMSQTFDTTVHNGRADKGMPPWKGVLSEDDIGMVKAFIVSVQP